MSSPASFFKRRSMKAQPDLPPDGRYIVYHSSVSGGTQQIFVQSFTGPGGRRQISTEGGMGPRWSPTGREIFYHDRDRQAIMAVEVRTEPELEVRRAPAPLRVAHRLWILSSLGRHARRSAFRSSG